MDDTRIRFLKAIAERFGVEHLVEVHLFSPIRQGVVETGVAMVAFEPTVPMEDGAMRLTVATARYRLTRKGPERGKWEFEAFETADAPLATVDIVARGVSQRAKDVTETERLSGEQVRSALEDPQWRTPT